MRLYAVVYNNGGEWIAAVEDNASITHARAFVVGWTEEQGQDAALKLLALVQQWQVERPQG